MTLATIAVLLLTLWAVLALYFDFQVAWLRLPLAIAYVVLVAVLLFASKRYPVGLALSVVAFLIVVTWWLTLKPSANRDWQADNAHQGWADVQGDLVTIHDFRYCNYRTEEDYTCSWETRTYHLSNLKYLDIFITWWGSPWIAHPILSFDFGDEGHVAMSIETRDVLGQSYSAVRGFYRQYELIYLAADERDIIRLRTNFRKDEEVYIFRLAAQPEQARGLFLQYLDRMNQLHAKPEWYNAIDNNCTTNIAVSNAASRDQKTKWDWRILLNGKGDEMLYQNGQLVTGGLTLPELKAQAHINAAGRAADNDPNWSTLIRKGRVGFAPEY